MRILRDLVPVDSVGDIPAEETADDLAILNKDGDDLLIPEEIEKPDDTIVGKDEDIVGLPKALKAKYPEIFKEFPEIRKAIFAEKEFLKLFGTVEEAKDASLKSANFDLIVGEIQRGNIQPLLDGLKETDDKLLRSFTRGILPAIYKQSKDMYFEIIDPILINVLKSAHENGSDDNVKNSALHLAKFLFGKIDVLDKPAGAKEVDPDREAFEKEKAEFMTQKFNEARTIVNDGITSELNKFIGEGLDNLGITPYMKKVIIKEIQNDVDILLAQNEDHMRQVDSLWKKAAQAGYPADQIARITSTYLARAKPLVPTVRSKVKAELMKTGKVVTPTDKLTPSGATKSGGRSGPVDAAKVDWRKTTDEQFLNGEITYKK